MGKKSKSEVSPLEAHLGYWMRFVSNRVSEEFRLAVEACGVSVTEWVALRTLFDVENATSGTLIEALGMTKGAVSKIVVRLEEKGLLLRKSDPSDARSVHLRLSAAGKALVPRLAQIADHNDNRFFGHLSEQQQSLLRDILEQTVRFHQLREVPVH